MLTAPSIASSGRPSAERGTNGRVERAEGRDIGLDPRFAYFRFRNKHPAEMTVPELLAASKEVVVKEFPTTV